MALGDIETNYKILEGIKRDPTLVGGLVAIGMAAINDGAIYDGLANTSGAMPNWWSWRTLWSRLIGWRGYQFAMRSEAAETAANIDYFKHQRSIQTVPNDRGAFSVAGWLAGSK